MRHTETPLAFAFARPEAKRILYHLTEHGPEPYSHVRKALDLDPQTFKRLTRRLAQFHAIAQRRAKDAEFEDNRIRMALEPTAFGQRLVETLRELDDVVARHQDDLGVAASEPLLV